MEGEAKGLEERMSLLDATTVIVEHNRSYHYHLQPVVVITPYSAAEGLLMTCTASTVSIHGSL
jgi:hypothetical protein